MLPILIYILLIASLVHSAVVARVDGKVITKKEFEELFRFYWKEMLHFSPKKATFEDRKLFLFEYIKGMVLEDVARNMGLHIPEKEVLNRLRKWGRRNPEEALIKLARRELISERVIEVIAGDIRVSEGEIKAYYLLNKREFHYPNQVKLLRVLTDTRNKAKKVRKTLLKGGLPNDVEGVSVGRERWYSIQSLPKKVRRSIYPYKVGTVSKPIRLESGYLVLKITDKRKAGVLPLEEVKEHVRAKLLKEKRQEVFRRWFREVIRGYRLEIFLKNL